MIVTSYMFSSKCIQSEISFELKYIVSMLNLNLNFNFNFNFIHCEYVKVDSWVMAAVISWF